MEPLQCGLFIEISSEFQIRKNEMYKTLLNFCIIFISSIIISCVGKTPTTIGVFSDCPEKPNCVSTKNSNRKDYIYPFKYKGSRSEAKRILILAVKSFGSSRIKNEQEIFIHVEFISEVFGFVDDVEFYFNKPGIIDFRSASRIGYSDLGVNRNRMEAVRKKFDDLVDSKM